MRRMTLTKVSFQRPVKQEHLRFAVFTDEANRWRQKYYNEDGII